MADWMDKAKDMVESGLGLESELWDVLEKAVRVVEAADRLFGDLSRLKYCDSDDIAFLVEEYRKARHG